MFGMFDENETEQTVIIAQKYTHTLTHMPSNPLALNAPATEWAQNIHLNMNDDLMVTVMMRSYTPMPISILAADNERISIQMM